MGTNPAVHLHAPVIDQLSLACTNLNQAFGTCYLVGSVTVRADWRDVDVRSIMSDEEFWALFRFDPKRNGAHLNLRWSIVCSLISQQLSELTKLPIDFQIQSMTQAQRYEGVRHPLGLFPFFPDDHTPECRGDPDRRGGCFCEGIAPMPTRDGGQT